MQTTQARSSGRKRATLLVNRDFALLWSGQAISNVGDFVFETTLVLWIGAALGHGQPWAPLAVSGVLFATVVPVVLVRPLAGVFVDRWDRRRTMLTMDAARAALIGLLAFTTSALPAIYAAVLLVAICSQFFQPALFALTGDVVPAAELPRASGLNQLMINLANIFGTAVAGPLLFSVGPRIALLANALSFAVSFATIFFVRSPAKLIESGPPVSGSPVVRPHLLRDFAEGITCVIRSPALRAIAVSLAVALFGIGALVSQNAFFVTGPLHAPPALFGLMGASFSAGSILSVALAARYLARLGLARTYWLAMVSVGVAIVAYARVTSFGTALAIFFAMGIPNAANVVTMQPLILRATPRALVGRVNSAIVSLYSLATLLSYAVAGALAGGPLLHFHAVVLGLQFGPLDTLFTAAGLLCVAGGLYAWFELRHAADA